MRKRHINGTHTVRFVLIALLVWGLMGCGIGSRRNRSRDAAQIRVTAVPNNTGALELTADDVVTILQECGFTDQQIYYHGAELREALLNMGGAKIGVGDHVEAIFKVQNDLVLISSASRGYMLYDAKSGRMQLGPAPPSR